MLNDGNIRGKTDLVGDTVLIAQEPVYVRPQEVVLKLHDGEDTFIRELKPFPATDTHRMKSYLGVLKEFEFKHALID